MSTCTIIGLEIVGKSDRRTLKQVIERVCAAALLPSGWTLELALISAEQMSELCTRFLGKNGPTDVLSFPASNEFNIPELENAMGEIAICLEVAQTQANTLGHSLPEEIGVLVAHGLLHLLGLDHDKNEDEARMQAECEMAILDLAGIRPDLALIGRSF